MKRNATQDFLIFLMGGALFSAGLFLFTNQVMVSSGYTPGGIGGAEWGRGYFGRVGGLLSGFFPMGYGQGFGLLMIPFGIGIGLLVADAFRKVGWFLILASSAAVGAGILQSLLFNFRSTSLFSLLWMVAMIAAGGGLMLRSLKGYDKEEKPAASQANKKSEQAQKELNKEMDSLRAKIRRRRSRR